MGRRLPPSIQKLDRIPDWTKASYGSGIIDSMFTGNDK